MGSNAKIKRKCQHFTVASTLWALGKLPKFLAAGGISSTPAPGAGKRPTGERHSLRALQDSGGHQPCSRLWLTGRGRHQETQRPLLPTASQFSPSLGQVRAQVSSVHTTVLCCPAKSTRLTVTPFHPPSGRTFPPHTKPVGAKGDQLCWLFEVDLCRPVK